MTANKLPSTYHCIKNVVKMDCSQGHVYTATVCKLHSKPNVLHKQMYVV